MTVVTYHGIEYEIPLDRDDPRFFAYDIAARADAEVITREDRRQEAS